MRTYGSGQTHGLPLVITALDLENAQVVHTFPCGSATPERVRLCAVNLDDDLPHELHVALYDHCGTLITDWTVVVKRGADGFDLLADHELVANGETVVKVYADAASRVVIACVVDDQGDVAGVVSQNVAMGYVAAVQNDVRYAVGCQGGDGQCEIKNAEILITRHCKMRNLRAYATHGLQNGARSHVSIYVNCSESDLSLHFCEADGTDTKTDTDTISLCPGDKVAFGISTDDCGDPCTHFQAAVELV